MGTTHIQATTNATVPSLNFGNIYQVPTFGNAPFQLERGTCSWIGCLWTNYTTHWINARIIPSGNELILSSYSGNVKLWLYRRFRNHHSWHGSLVAENKDYMVPRMELSRKGKVDVFYPSQRHCRFPEVTWQLRCQIKVLLLRAEFISTVSLHTGITKSSWATAILAATEICFNARWRWLRNSWYWLYAKPIERSTSRCNMSQRTTQNQFSALICRVVRHWGIAISRLFMRVHKPFRSSRTFTRPSFQPRVGWLIGGYVTKQPWLWAKQVCT